MPARPKHSLLRPLCGLSRRKKQPAGAARTRQQYELGASSAADSCAATHWSIVTYSRGTGGDAPSPDDAVASIDSSSSHTRLDLQHDLQAPDRVAKWQVAA